MLQSALLIVSFFLFAASFFLFYHSRHKQAVIVLILGAFVLRIYMSMLDPFLHDWDEHFHALVAKNMMQYPFKPMLRLSPVLDYDYTAWCCNYIWLHKQPLFLWQMAASMKLFGINEIALRLPSAIMGSLLVFLVYRMGSLSVSEQAGYFSALLFATAYYQLEQTSGNIGMDHNDIAFMFYTTASIWALLEYFKSEQRYWIFLIGLFAGCAILNKWLTGLLVFAVWGGTLLLNKDFRLKQYARLLAAGAVSIAVALPWNLYIYLNYPKESLYEWQFSSRHFGEVIENHSGSLFYYLHNMPYHYNYGSAFLLFIGIVFFLLKGKERVFKLPIILSVLVIYLFFSLAKTKLPSYVYVVAPFMYLFLGTCLENILQHLKQQTKSIAIVAVAAFLFCLWNLRPLDIKAQHVSNKPTAFMGAPQRVEKINNTNLYKKLNDLVPPDFVLLNCKSYEDVDARFYATVNAYHWWPSEVEYAALKQKGIKFAAFNSHTNQPLPDFLKSDTTLLIIDADIK